MAIFVFRMKTFSRSAASRGSRATSAAAYRAGERIRDLRTGATYDHRRRQDVLHKEIVLPRALERSAASLRWARERASLWNAAEHAETRRNSRVAREFMVALPHELNARARLALARGFARELVERYNNAIDLVIHAPRGDQRNFHAHLLATTREVTPEGLSRKAALELSGTERHRRGLLRWGEERSWLRERWAGLTNEALKAAHLQARVSHQYPARDLTRMPRLPSMAYHIERRGGHSLIAERIRERHHAVLEQSLPDQTPTPARAPARGEAARGPARGLHRPTWLERVREQARSTWQSLRARTSLPLPADRQPVASVEAQSATATAFVNTRAQPATASAAAAAAAVAPAAAAVSITASQSQCQSQSASLSLRDRQSPWEEQARRSYENWKALRAELAANPKLALELERSRAAGLSRQHEQGLDMDLGL